MRSAARLLVVTITGIVVALLPVHALAESDRSDREYGIVAQQTTTPAAPSTAPTVDLEPAETQADKNERNRKIVLGVASAVLLGIVIWGRSVRRKRAKSG